MPSTYTTNLLVEKPATGEQIGTWGATANKNFDLFDAAIAGHSVVTLPAAGSSGSPNALTLTSGDTSDGRKKFVEFDDGGDLGATAFVQFGPQTAKKISYIKNSLSGSRALTIFQGTYSAPNAITVPNGKVMILLFSGTGSGSTVTDITNPLHLTAVDTVTFSINGAAVTATAAELNILDGVTATASEINKLDGLTATTTELNYVDGVTSNIQTQIDDLVVGGGGTWGSITGTLSNQTDLNSALNGKQATLTGAATTIATSNLTANRAAISNGSGKVAISATTSTELGYLSGVTSAIQTQLNAKAGTASPSFTGTVSIGANWSVTQSGTDLDFRYNGTVVMSISSTGTVKAKENFGKDSAP